MSPSNSITQPPAYKYLRKSSLRLSHLEVQSSWKLLLSDFNQFEPLICAWLEGTKIKRSQHADKQIYFEIIYPQYLNHQYQYLENNPDGLNRFKNYLAEIVEEPHQVKIVLDNTLTESEKGEETPLDMMTFTQKPESAYQKDRQREPLLEVLDSIFKFQFLGSQKIKETPKTEAPHEHAEDA